MAWTPVQQIGQRSEIKGSGEDLWLGTDAGTMFCAGV